VPVAEALGHARQGAARAGRTLDAFHSCALTNVALLQPGEAADSDRIKAAIGPNVMASVYYFYDEVQERGIDPPPFLSRIWKRYCALVEQTPPEHRHFRTHEFHYTALHPGEAELIDAQLIRDTCLVGTPDELIERIRELEVQGLQELIFAVGTGAKWRLAEDFARQVMARL
jgi:alkanesulfonate monooxygenase SsuD/methylene tetrahydromethanopterin reductase-like flavin-dependent oxidoreductase (luciferase family)